MARYCRYCGNPITDNAKFCGSCGRRLEVPLLRNDEYHQLLLQLRREETRSSGKLDNLTPEAQLVLDLYKEAIKAVAPELDEWDYQHPELQLTRWDAGWRQYRDLIKEKAPEANQKLRDAIKALGNKLRPLVYELGFLRK